MQNLEDLINVKLFNAKQDRCLETRCGHMIDRPFYLRARQYEVGWWDSSSHRGRISVEPQRDTMTGKEVRVISSLQDI